MKKKNIGREAEFHEFFFLNQAVQNTNLFLRLDRHARVNTATNKLREYFFAKV